MVRSQLLMDYVKGNVNTENVLYRLKLILTDLNHDSIINWIDGELGGYKNPNDIPEYRILDADVIGDFYEREFGSRSYRLRTQSQVPLHLLEKDNNKDIIHEMQRMVIFDSIEALTSFKQTNQAYYQRFYPSSLCKEITVSSIVIRSMYGQLPAHKIIGILSNIKNTLLGILMELDEQLDTLDSLDIRPQLENASKKEKIIYNIEKLIYSDQSIKLGDGNEISKSSIGHKL